MSSEVYERIMSNLEQIMASFREAYERDEFGIPENERLKLYTKRAEVWERDSKPAPNGQDWMVRLLDNRDGWLVTGFGLNPVEAMINAVLEDHPEWVSVYRPRVRVRYLRDLINTLTELRHSGRINTVVYHQLKGMAQKALGEARRDEDNQEDS